MKFHKSISWLVLVIILLSSVASAYGVFSNDGSGQYEFKSIHNQTVDIYGKGIYRNDSVSAAAQAIAQDTVTLILGIPLLALSLYLSRKGLLKGRLLLAGTLGYFLYTYASYAFLSMYNPLFLIYVILFSTSLFAFILTMMSFDINNLNSYFKQKFPGKLIGSFLMFLGAAITLMWLGRIVPPLINGTVPVGLEHYTTLVIQVLDLGLVVPTAVLSGILLIRKNPFGYLLSSVVIIKGITMLTAISAMIVGMINAGVEVSLVEIILFPIFNLVVIYFLVLIMKNINEPIAH